MNKFDARAIPGRAHYDRLISWTSSLFGRMTGQELSEIQAELTRDAMAAIQGDDDDAKLRAVLAEIGFCAVIDSMADQIEAADEGAGS